MTEDGFTYVLKVGKEMDEHYPLTVVVSASIPTTRASTKEEKAEEKTKLDKEFQTKREALEKKLAKEQGFEGRLFLIAKFSVEQLEKNRADLLVPKPTPTPTATPSPTAKKARRQLCARFEAGSKPDSGVRANEKPGTLFPRCRA